ncbi:hypothetical protein DFH07DRAFT_867982 [Mycena maculata]|uniref:CxC2-like cysteine cluster KDZ transposase-associated domain-containing protein n=1 Tax=Mycena maculata TaxID=230809 RepID=A0AAD7NG47_9AGAR|nr:hypothetical protein DFH07DRAFT_867982 [Mycena maculata]
MASKSHKRKAGTPRLLSGAHAVASTSSQSVDVHRQRTRRAVHTHETGTPAVSAEDEWEEDLQSLHARGAADFSWGLGDTSFQPEAVEEPDDGITVEIGSPRRANKSDRPLKVWRPETDEYVQATLRKEGRGSDKVHRHCASSGCNGPAEYRCVDGLCVGEVMRCEGCIVAAHQQLPTHFIERWNGKHFVRSLRDLGLRIQMGHPPGVICHARKPAPADFVLYDLTGVHEVNVDFCGCFPRVERRIQLMNMGWWPATVAVPNTCATFAVLKLLQILNCLGKLSAYDFLRGLERLTNNDGLSKPPDRRRPFMSIVRQWQECKRLKRFKCGHAPGGWAATAQGELVPLCRGCPQPGWNLPPDWEKVPLMYRYIYFLFLAEDANFRLGNRYVSSEEADPIWRDGFGFFVKREGEDGYKAHILKHASEQEISSCSGFQAMFLANMKRVKGLRTTGIGGVTCSRHNMWRPNGMGDLQLGERYCNMDFLFLSSVLTFAMLYIILSYDIVCQISKKFFQRMELMPDTMKLKIPMENVWWKVPNFHLPPHKPPCHSPYSFHYMFGAGASHGEGVEQNWAFSNGVAASTKLMGPGSRASTLEDIFGFHNYDRQLAMHRVLPKRLAEHMREGTKHNAALTAFTEGLEEERADEVAEWKDMVLTWEAEQHVEGDTSPFEYKETVKTLREIQVEIAREELILTEDGVEVEQESTPSMFLTMGLGLESLQRNLEIDIRAVQHPTPNQNLGFLKRRTALIKKIHKFHQLQLVYMPAVRSFLSDHEKQVFDGNGEQPAETTRLFMPSEIADPGTRGRACALGLAEVEARMREGEVAQALDWVRKGLRTKTGMSAFKILNYTGQGAMTRSQGVLRQVDIEIHLAKIYYRYACAALLALRGHGVWEERLRVLKDDDVRGLNTDRGGAGRSGAPGRSGTHDDDGGRALAAERLVAGEGSHTMSWIWYTVGLRTGDDDPKLHEALRAEWCKAYARSRRLGEEVRHLREEMRRTIAFGYTAAGKWDILADDVLDDASAELTEGRQAYAAEQADRERQTCEHLKRCWAGILSKADQYLDGLGVVDSVPVRIQLELGDELDPDEEEALLEGEDE